MVTVSNLNTMSGKSRVTFELQAGQGRLVYIAGSFNDWDPEKLIMVYHGDIQGYIFELQLHSGNYEYKFIVDGEWVTDLDNTNFSANDFGTLNSVLNIG